ncbi:MAG: hypothetical protein HY931_03175 [Candidatus Falkowbacteria bacterium]|nr:MAG: hypothetical protein HY931_03175 [Candidatus Falkowbacteria bacterium]
MKTKIQALVNLLLKLHKALLDLERTRYEAEYGPILDNSAYFNLVISHEDFKWLSGLLEIIALLDEESEAENISAEKIADLITNLKNLLEVNDNSEFSQRYQAALKNPEISQFDNELKTVISKLTAIN